MYRVTKTFRFEAAHFLPDHDGKCKGVHGHSYRVDVTYASQGLVGSGSMLGMVVDFSLIKKRFQPVYDALDHKLINDTEWFKEHRLDEGAPPTAEVLAEAMFRYLVHRGDGVLESVRVWETADSFAEYSR